LRPTESGAMLPMIFVHGSGHTQASFDAQLAAFPSADAVSLPGHPEGKALTSVGDSAVWLSKYLHWKGCGPAIVAGQSLGGAIALEWALRYPADAAGLVLIGAGARLRVAQQIFDMIDNDWPGCIETLIAYSVSASASEPLKAQMKAWHLDVGQDSTRQDYANCNAWDAMERVGQISVPTAIVVGADDRMTPPKYSQFLAEKIGGAVLEIVPNAGHMVHAQSPEAVNALIRKTFAGVAA
jgi:pimeloyl-ACP methyl ester carboxylesterase